MSAAAAAPAGDAPPKKGSKKLIIIVAVVLLLVLGGGGAAFFMMKKKAAEEEEEGSEASGGHAKAAAHAPAAKPAKRDPSKPPTYVPLDPFVVNLADRDHERYAQIGITLEDEPADPVAGRSRCTAAGHHRREPEARAGGRPVTGDRAASATTTWPARSASSVGACPRWRSSTSASRATSASACST
jgi:hypothetical protein